MHQLQTDLLAPHTPNSQAQGYFSTPWGDGDADTMTSMGSTGMQPQAYRAIGPRQLQLGEVHPGIPEERRSVDWWPLQEEPLAHQNPQVTEEPGTTFAERTRWETQEEGPEQQADQEVVPQ